MKNLQNTNQVNSFWHEVTEEFLHIIRPGSDAVLKYLPMEFLIAGKKDILLNIILPLN